MENSNEEKTDQPTMEEIDSLLPKEYVGNWIAKHNQINRKVYMPTIEAYPTVKHGRQTRKKRKTKKRGKSKKKTTSIQSTKIN